jgi:hypothetical protein
MQRSKSLALMFLLGALLVGGALGFTVDRMVVGERICARERTSWREELATHLDLTPAQRAAMDSILDKRHEDMSRVFATVRPQLDSIRDGARAQILSRLDERQRAEFQEFMRRKEEEKRRKEGSAR